MLTCAEHFNVAEIMEQLKNYKATDTVAQVTRKEAEVFPAVGRNSTAWP